MNTLVDNALELTFRPDMDLLFGRWQRQTSDEEVYRAYDAILAEAACHQTHYWLLDIRRRGAVSRNATRWVVETFLPSLFSRLREQVFIAYLLSPSHLAEAKLLESSPAPNSSGWHVRMFADECAALQWLQSSRAQNGD